MSEDLKELTFRRIHFYNFWSIEGRNTMKEYKDKLILESVLCEKLLSTNCDEDFDSTPMAIRYAASHFTAENLITCARYMQKYKRRHPGRAEHCGREVRRILQILVRKGYSVKAANMAIQPIEGFTF